jgi:hypothetical protein
LLRARLRLDNLPSAKDLKKALRDYRADCKRTNDKDLLFRSRHKDPTAPLSANAVAQWFRDLYTRRLEGYSSHSGRRNFGTQAARNAVKAGARCATCKVAASDQLAHS